MKYTILFLSALLVVFSATQTCAQNGPIRKLYKKYKSNEGATAITLPGIIVHSGLGIANGFMSKEDKKDGEQELLEIAWGIRKLRILNIKKGNPIPDRELESCFQKLRNKGHEDLVFVRAKGTHVSIMIRDKRKKLRSVLILISEKGQLTLIHAKTRIAKKHLWELINFMLEKEGKDPI